MPRPKPRRPAAQASASQLAKPGAAALCAEGRQKTPDSPHVRASGVVRDGLEAGKDWPRQSGAFAGGAVAVFDAA